MTFVACAPPHLRPLFWTTREAQWCSSNTLRGHALLSDHLDRENEASCMREFVHVCPSTVVKMMVLLEPLLLVFFFSFLLTEDVSLCIHTACHEHFSFLLSCCLTLRWNLQSIPRVSGISALALIFVMSLVYDTPIRVEWLMRLRTSRPLELALVRHMPISCSKSVRP